MKVLSWLSTFNLHPGLKNSVERKNSVGPESDPAIHSDSSGSRSTTSAALFAYLHSNKRQTGVAAIFFSRPFGTRVRLSQHHSAGLVWLKATAISNAFHGHTC
jgi:hypothetical protein